MAVVVVGTVVVVRVGEDVVWRKGEGSLQAREREDLVMERLR